MNLIFDEIVRENIEISLKAVPLFIPALAQQSLTIEGIDAFCQILIADNCQDVINDTRQYLSHEISIAYYGALIIGMLSLIVDEEPILSPSWINADCIPNPNFVLSKMFVNISNCVLGVITLVEVGLDSPARAALRKLLELSWLTLVIFAKQEKIIAYIQGQEEEEHEIYRKHFSPKKLRQELINVEILTGLAEVAQRAVSEIREELYGSYSQAVHNRYSELIGATMSFSLEREGILVSSLFGQANKASYPTIYHMNDALFYFLAMIRRILEQVHNLKPPYSIKWQEALAMQESFAYVVLNRVKKQL
jgi:hypothetical protein